MAMDKYFSLAGKTAEGRPLVHLVEPGSRYGLNESSGLEKTASGEHLPEVLELIESIEPQAGRLYLVNSALGAGEFVGFNLRGDWFTERGLVHEPPGWHDIPVWDIEARRQAAARTEDVARWGPMAWGYPTFYNAHRFRHHVNKDPTRAYGFILGAFWDPRMHRVILVSELIKEYCARLGALDLYSRIERGEFPDTSMGAKVPNDRCSICNHSARTPAEYCEHVRSGALPPYGMRKILQDGRMCGVYNDYPRFIDDSFVFIGAERSAKVMANVTDLLKGGHVYTNSVYSPDPAPRMKAASGTPEASQVLDEKAEDEADLGKALAEASTSPVAGPESKRMGERLSSILSLIPVMGPVEQKALDHVVQESKRRARLRDGNLTPGELSLWTSREMRRLLGEGVDIVQVERARALVHHQMERVFGEKVGTAAKWAEHLKHLPAPLPHQLSLIGDQHARVQAPLPLPVLREIARPGLGQGLSDIAHLGVVLRPEEFQYCAMHQMSPDSSLAEDLHRQGTVFSAVPLWQGLRPRFRMRSMFRAERRAELLKLLGGLLQQRSFSPTVIQIRIRHPMAYPPAASPRLTPKYDSTLNKVAQLYTDYRVGLLETPPDWRYMSTTQDSASFAKSAEMPNLLSSYLFQLAYWPADAIG